MSRGYEYLQALTDAIEAWSAAITDANPASFVWRGADLRHAAERALFFERVNDADRRREFARQGAVSIQVAPVGTRKRWLHEAANLSRLFRSPFGARRAAMADILFLVIHPKFVTFFEPIVRELGARAAFLTIMDPVTESYLAERDLPARSVRLAFSPYLVPKGVLRGFLPLTRAYDLVSRLFGRVMPKVVVVPEGNAAIYEVAHRAGMRQGVSTICIQHGAPAYTNPGFRNWTFADVLVWGEQFIEPFAKYNPGQHFSAVGTPAAFGTPRLRTVEEIKVIGFFLQKAAENIPPQEWRDMLNLIRWVSDTFPAVTVVIREHPTQPRLDKEELDKLGSAANLRFMSPLEFTLNDALDTCDVIVAGASTTLFEAIVTGAIPLIFGTAFSKDFPRIAEAGAAIAARDLEEAKKTIQRLIEDDGWRAKLRVEGQRLRPELFASFGHDGALKISEFLVQAVARMDREKRGRSCQAKTS